MNPTDTSTQFVVICKWLSCYSYIGPQKGCFDHKDTHYWDTYPIVLVRVEVTRTDHPYPEDE